MKLKFHRETKIIFAILCAIIIASGIWIAVNYRKLKQPIVIPQNSVAQSQVKGAEIPIQPRGTCVPNTAACAGDPKLCMEENKNAACN